MLFSKSAVATAGFGVTAAVFFVGGLLLLCLGVLGEYLGRVYDEVRSRPLSIIDTVHRSPAKIAPQFGVIPMQASSDQNQEGIEAA